MDIVKIFVIVITAVFTVSILKQAKSSIVLPATALFCIVIIKYVLTRAHPQMTVLEAAFDSTSLSEYINPLLKVFGVAILTETTSDICRQAGENTFASKVELIGKVEMIILCFPFVEKILDIIKNMIMY